MNFDACNNQAYDHYITEKDIKVIKHERDSTCVLCLKCSICTKFLDHCCGCGLSYCNFIAKCCDNCGINPLTNNEEYPFDFCETIQNIGKTGSMGKLDKMGKICKCGKEFITYAFYICVECNVFSYLRYESVLDIKHMMGIYSCNCNMDTEIFSHIRLTRIQKLKLIKQLTIYFSYT
jgi:hypothetical protein